MTRFFLFLVLLFLATCTVPAQHHWDMIRSKTEGQLQEIAANARGVLGIAALDLTSGEYFGVNDSMLFPQGSAIKIPVLMEVFRQGHEGKFNLNDTKPVPAAMQVGGSGVLQFFAPGTSHLSIGDLCTLMITLSDNTATNILIDLAGMENVNRMLSSLGFRATRLQRIMMDQKASAQGEENLSTPAEATRLLRMLYNGEFVNRETCDRILTLLTYPKPGRGAIASGIPGDIPVAYKPGDIAGVNTEWAIVRLPGRPYALAIMENYQPSEEGPALMQQVSRVVFDYFWRLGRATRYGTYVEPPTAK